MRQIETTAELASMASAIERFADEFDPTMLASRACGLAIPEVEDLIAKLGPQSPGLDRALRRLHAILEKRLASQGARLPDPNATRKLRRLLRALTPLAAAALAVSSLSATSAAAQATPATTTSSAIAVR